MGGHHPRTGQNPQRGGLSRVTIPGPQVTGCLREQVGESAEGLTSASNQFCLNFSGLSGGGRVHTGSLGGALEVRMGGLASPWGNKTHFRHQLFLRPTELTSDGPADGYLGVSPSSGREVAFL